MDPLTILSLALLAYILYSIMKHFRAKSLFESKGIPFLGNGILRFLHNAIHKVHMTQDIRKMYEKVKNTKLRMAGSTEFGTPTLWVQDPELIKAIMVKDFDHFVDRGGLPLGEHDELLGNMLFAIEGDKWKALRVKLTPTFSTGKIRRLVGLMDQSGQRMVTFLSNEIQGTTELDFISIYSKYLMDIVASVAYGYESQAFNQKEPSLFEEMGKRLQLNFGGTQALRLFFMQFSMRLSNLFGVSLVDKQVQEFFIMAATNTIKKRLESGEKRDDYIQLMLEARGKDEISSSGESEMKAEVLDEFTIACNSGMFILGGFDTTMSLLIFVTYALSLNQEIQERLRGEIDKTWEDCGGNLTYEVINGMGYLDMVIQETLRFYPPVASTPRVCTKDYKVPGTNLTLRKGQVVNIPIYGLHHDPEFYPDPEKFDPERFSPQNKANINQFAFLPFGGGPRNCIGMRFAFAQVKVGIIHLIRNFKVQPSPKTLIPMKLETTVSLTPEGGVMHLSLTKIT